MIERREMLLRLVAVALLAIPTANAMAEPSFVETPAIAPNPNPSVPLSAIVSFTASEPVSTTITVSDESRVWKLNYSEEDDAAKGLPVVGMKYGRSHKILTQGLAAPLDCWRPWMTLGRLSGVTTPMRGSVTSSPHAEARFCSSRPTTA